MRAPYIESVRNRGNLFSGLFERPPHCITPGATMPRVSVLMPAYNSEKYIATAIESILNQTFSDFEFIIINDGSTDNTAKIVRQYARRDPRIKFVDNKKNRGISETRNSLLDMATGEYAAYQDSDDVSMPNRLAQQVKFLDSNPEISVVGAAMQAFPIARLIKCPTQPRILDFYFANAVSNPTVMMRMRDIKSAGLRYDTDLSTAEDYDFWFNVIKRFNIYNLPDVLVNYRVLPTSLSHNNPKLDECNAKIRGKILNFLASDEAIRTNLAPTRRLYLFGVLPIFKLKRTRIYLFEIIPLFKRRGRWWWLFDVFPFITQR